MVWQDSKDHLWRFAILRHTRQQDVHWDLLLELPDRPLLATWQVHSDPAEWTNYSAGVFSAAVRALPDHRRIYLDYQGPISGDRGEVMRVDEGYFRLVSESGEKIVLEASGKKLQAHVELTLMDSAANLWQLQVAAIQTH
ncbi:MAG TPA: hypothetical protein VKJ65_01580 [Phycisphaerae bacterium]|nr:hypothetical protein [Phycisphaerae bacterium]